ncbi:thioredoxin family protein [Polaribacter pacificus]|uniref:Thioredoxin family protein n=1 Tax=Polaribacter pacificus TaxID=1775173 RepID=A0A917MDY0_9FLAO|nr:bacillithiol system redox-active protein YtxJ [Polaribacter pacificus]GGG98249.1 thioredoxin family protein [Polaribacter pacificus]
MSLFKNLFNGDKDENLKAESTLNWIPLNSLSELDQIISDSNEETLAIFKHSTRCGISSMVKRQFEKNFEASLKDFKVYYLDLLAHRDVSNAIEEKLGVRHQSPQLVLIKNGAVIDHASHNGILNVDFKKIN